MPFGVVVLALIISPPRLSKKKKKISPQGIYNTAKVSTKSRICDPPQYVVQFSAQSPDKQTGPLGMTVADGFPHVKC